MNEIIKLNVVFNSVGTIDDSLKWKSDNPSNGRLNTYGNIYYVDGEGRYCKKGLYLYESR